MTTTDARKRNRDMADAHDPTCCAWCSKTGTPCQPGDVAFRAIARARDTLRTRTHAIDPETGEFTSLDFHREWLHVMDTQHPHTPQESDMDDLPRTVITLTGGRGPLHVAKGVLVNGSPVTVAEHGVDIDFGPDEVTTVTLRLLADEVHFVKSERVEATLDWLDEPVPVPRPEPGDVDPDVIAADLEALKHELETPMLGHGERCEPAPADVDPDEALGALIWDRIWGTTWSIASEVNRAAYRNLARAVREHIEAEDAAAHPVGCGQMIRDVRDGSGFSTQIDGVLIAKCDTYGRTKSESVANARAEKAEADLARVTEERDEWQGRHKALREDVESLREAWKVPSILSHAVPHLALDQALARDTERAES